MAAWQFPQPHVAAAAAQVSWSFQTAMPGVAVGTAAPALETAGRAVPAAAGHFLDAMRHFTVASSGYGLSGAATAMATGSVASSPSPTIQNHLTMTTGTQKATSAARDGHPAAAKGLVSTTPRAGILARIGAQLDSLEDRLANGARSSGSSSSGVLRAVVRRGLEGSSRRDEVSQRGRSVASAAGAVNRCATSTGGSVNLESSPGDDNSNDERDAPLLPPGDAGFTEVGSHLRAFLEHRGWDVCSIEQLGSASSPPERATVSGATGLQRFRQACLAEGALVRGWVSSRSDKLRVMRVRLVAVELPSPTEGTQSASSSSKGDRGDHRQGRTSNVFTGGPVEDFDWMSAAAEEDGIFGALHAEDTCFAVDRIGSAEVMQLLPVGTLVRARLLRGADVDRRLLRGCNASCMLSLLSTGQTGARAPGVLSLGGFDTEEWPPDGGTAALSVDPRFLNRRGLNLRVQKLGLRRIHATLFAEDRNVDFKGESLGAEISRIQGRSWADRRVREGVSRARAGDQKGALERYDAALELCPRHKEGLVARGAALTNVGRRKEAMRDFDAALAIDPTNANALKYREIARKRAREDGDFPSGGPTAVGTTSGGAGADRKRRRGT